jgi:hypothetical protein
MVAFGMLFSTAGAGLAVSGIASDTNNASVAQYGTPTPTPTATPCGNNSSSSSSAASEECAPTPTPTASNNTPEGGVLPAEETNNAPSGGTAPAEETNTNTPPTTSDTQPTRQVEATAGSQLPFTGFAAIPVMLGGIALLTGGLVLRRRTRSE